MSAWRVFRTGALGVEFTLWCGVGVGADLFHAYARLGVATVYVSRFPLDRMLSMWRAARDTLRSRSGFVDDARQKLKVVAQAMVEKPPINPDWHE